STATGAHAGHPAPGGHDAHRDQAHHGGDAHGSHHGHAGHGGHGDHGDHVAMFRRMFWWMLALSVPVVLTSSGFADLLGYSLPDASGLTWVAPVLGTVIYAWGGRPFLTGAVDELRQRRPGMMLLIG